MKPITAYYNTLFNLSSPKTCFVGAPDCTKSIRAHALSESRVLNEIAEDGMVVTIVPGTQENNFVDIGPVGKGQASTFAGFCTKHDQLIFDPIDNEPYVYPNYKQEFLYMYRAMAKNYWHEATNFNACKKKIELYDQGKTAELRNFVPFDVTPQMVDSWRAQYAHAANVMKSWDMIRTVLNDVVTNGTYDEAVATIAVIMPIEYPIAASGIGMMTYGRAPVEALEDPLPFSITVFPQAGKTIVLFSCINLPSREYMIMTIRAHQLEANGDYGVVLTNMFANIPIESFMVQPSYWAALSTEQRSRFMQRWRHKSNGGNMTGDDLFDPTLTIFV